MQIDFEDAKFLIEAGAAAQERWNIADAVVVVKADASPDTFAIPIYDNRSRWWAEQHSEWTATCPWLPFGHRGEEIVLEKFSDGKRVIRMGYGPLGRVLLLEIK